MMDVFVIMGARDFVCQACRKRDLPLNLGNQKCECGCSWDVLESRGDPFAMMDLVKNGVSTQSGDPYSFSGYLVKVKK